MTSTTPPMQHPGAHIQTLASRPLAVLPPPLESLIPTPVCHHGNSTHREACHRFGDTRAIGKRTHTHTHSLTLMHSCRTGGDQTFLRAEQWPLRNLQLAFLAHATLTVCQYLTQKTTLSLKKNKKKLNLLQNTYIKFYTLLMNQRNNKTLLRHFKPLLQHCAEHLLRISN